MTEDQKNKEYFEIFYHPNEYTQLFKCAFESMVQAESLIEKEYPDFTMVARSKAG